MQTTFKVEDGIMYLAVPLPEAKEQLVKGQANGKLTFAFKEAVKAPKGGEFPLEECPIHQIGEETMRFYDFSVTAKAFGQDAIVAKETSLRKQKMRRALADAKKLDIADMLLFTEGKKTIRGFKWKEFDEDKQKAVMAKLSGLQGKPAAGWKSLQALTTAFINNEVSREDFERLANELNAASKARVEKMKAAKAAPAAKVAEPTV